MPRGNYKAPYRPPFDPTITQSIELALRDAGRDDLVDALRKAGMANLEESLHRAKERIHALELEKKNWLTESGMFRALDKRAAKVAIKWGKKALWWLIGLSGTATAALAGWVFKHIQWK